MQVSEYVNSYRIPAIGTGTDGGISTKNFMFSNTGGTWTGEPDLNTTYYTSNTIVKTDGTIIGGNQ